MLQPRDQSDRQNTNLVSLQYQSADISMCAEKHLSRARPLEFTKTDLHYLNL
jgi:hypothetical protein